MQLTGGPRYKDLPPIMEDVPFWGAVLLGIGKNKTEGELQFAECYHRPGYLVGNVTDFHNSTREMILLSTFCSWGN